MFQKKKIAKHDIRLYSHSFYRYCSRSCLTMMAGVGVAQKLQKIIRIFDEATSVKTIYKQSSGTGIQAISLPKTLGHYCFYLNPFTVSAETVSVVNPFQVAIVFVKEDHFSVVMILKNSSFSNYSLFFQKAEYERQLLEQCARLFTKKSQCFDT